MKKLISIVLGLALLLSFTACAKDKSNWKTAKHTYSLLGFSVEYSYPDGLEAISSDDDSTFMLLEDKSNTSNWSLLVDINAMSYLEFCDYKGECAKSANDILQENDIWIFKYTEPYQRTVMLKWFECGKTLIVNKSNDFDLNDAIKVVESLSIDVFGEDVR